MKGPSESVVVAFIVLFFVAVNVVVALVARGRQ